MRLTYTLDGTDRYEVEIADELAKELMLNLGPFSIGKTNNE
jgi:hypothetical protein